MNIPKILCFIAGFAIGGLAGSLLQRQIDDKYTDEIRQFYRKKMKEAEGEADKSTPDEPEKDKDIYQTLKEDETTKTEQQKPVNLESVQVYTKSFPASKENKEEAITVETKEVKKPFKQANKEFKPDIYDNPDLDSIPEDVPTVVSEDVYNSIDEFSYYNAIGCEKVEYHFFIDGVVSDDIHHKVLPRDIPDEIGNQAMKILENDPNMDVVYVVNKSMGLAIRILRSLQTYDEFAKVNKISPMNRT